MSYRIHTNCRACGYGPAFEPGGTKTAAKSDHLESVLDLGVMPLANAFRKTGQSRPGHYPIELLVCPRCTLGQLSAVVDPAIMYDNYPYVTSPSQTMLNHFHALWSEISKEKTIESVVEIGSNDGLFLDYFRKVGVNTVLGIDPAKNLVEAAVKRGVNSLCCMFDREAAEMARSSMPPIDLILARHVFCHVDDWQAFVNNLGVMCQKETLVCIEVPHAHEMLMRCEWDTIYAEHMSYLTIKSVQHLLEGSLLKLQKVVQFPVHGGAIALFLRRRDSSAARDPSVVEFMEKECCQMEDWKHFAATARDQINGLSMLVRNLVEDGKRVCGYGASAKSTVWVNACKFNRKQIQFICDSTASKVYSTSPGTDIPIVHEGDHFTNCMDYVVMFCWNYQLELMKRELGFNHKGFKWIVPVPTIKIYDDRETEEYVRTNSSSLLAKG